MSEGPEITESVKTENPLWGQTKSFLAGGFGGVCAVLVGHPFDLVKVRLQTSNEYKGMLDVVTKTLSRDGPKGLYRGVVAPLYGVTPMFAISFWGYDLGQRVVSSVANVQGTMSIGQISAAGFLSAIPTTAVAAPFERVKVILQLQGQGKSGTNKQFNGALDVVKHLYKTGGVSSVMKGSVATMCRDGPGSALYFATYEYLKRTLTPEGTSMSLGAIVVAGGTAGTAMWIPVFPIDTIKSNLQMSDTKQSIGEVTRKIYRQGGGIKAFFPGLGPALLRSFPANAATFLGVELAHKFFKTMNI